jgi:hypothetical protein
MTRKSHLRLASSQQPGNLSALIFWKNEARRLKAAYREALARANALSRDRAILWKAWDAVTRGEHEQILKLGSGMSDEDFISWLAELSVVSGR